MTRVKLAAPLGQGSGSEVDREDAVEPLSPSSEAVISTTTTTTITTAITDTAIAHIDELIASSKRTTIQPCQEAAYCCPAGGCKDSKYVEDFHAMMTQYAELAHAESCAAQQRLMAYNYERKQSTRQRKHYLFDLADSQRKPKVVKKKKHRKLLQAYCIANTVPGVKTHTHTGCTRDAAYRLQKHNCEREGGPRNTRKVCSAAKGSRPWFICSVMTLPAGREYSGKTIRRRWTYESRGMEGRVRTGYDLSREHGCEYFVSEKVARLLIPLRNTIFDTRSEEEKMHDRTVFLPLSLSDHNRHHHHQSHNHCMHKTGIPKVNFPLVTANH